MNKYVYNKNGTFLVNLPFIFSGIFMYTYTCKNFEKSFHTFGSSSRFFYNLCDCFQIFILCCIILLHVCTVVLLLLMFSVPLYMAYSILTLYTQNINSSMCLRNNLNLDKPGDFGKSCKNI